MNESNAAPTLVTFTASGLIISPKNTFETGDLFSQMTQFHNFSFFPSDPKISDMRQDPGRWLRLRPDKHPAISTAKDTNRQLRPHQG